MARKAVSPTAPSSVTSVAMVEKGLAGWPDHVALGEVRIE